MKISLILERLEASVKKHALFSFLKFNFLNSLYILDISPLSDVGLVKIFSQSVGCHFVLLTVSFALQKRFSFKWSYKLLILEPEPLGSA